MVSVADQISIADVGQPDSLLLSLNPSSPKPPTRTYLVSNFLLGLASAVSAMLAMARVGVCAEPVYKVERETWPCHIIDDEPIGADGVRLGDLNRDGLLDIVCGWEQSGVTKVYLNPGRAKAKERWPAVIVGKTPNVEDAFFVDLDQDGRLDVVACCELDTQEVRVFWGPKEDADLLKPEAWTGGSFPALSGRGGWMYGLPMQLDGKNGPDLFLGSKARGREGSIGWLESPASPRDLAAWTWHPQGGVQFVRSLVAADIDRDGDEDVLVHDDPNGDNPKGFVAFYWFENPGLKTVASQWARHDIGGKAGLFFGVGDIDKDGQLDLAWSGSTVVVLRGQVNGWDTHEIDATAFIKRSRGSHLRDFDGDGNLELVCSGVPHHIWNFNGSLAPKDWTLTLIQNTRGPKPDRNESLDLDGDGDQDLITCEELYEKRGLGLFWHENPR